MHNTVLLVWDYDVVPAAHLVDRLKCFRVLPLAFVVITLRCKMSAMS